MGGKLDVFQPNDHANCLTWLDGSSFHQGQSFPSIEGKCPDVPSLVAWSILNGQMLAHLIAHGKRVPSNRIHQKFSAFLHRCGCFRHTEGSGSCVSSLGLYETASVNVPFPPVISLWWKKQRIDLPGVHGKGYQPFVLKVDFANKVVSGSFGDPITAHGQRSIFHPTYAPQRRSQQHEPRLW